MDFIQEQFEEAAKNEKNEVSFELSEKELENVSGGTEESFFSHWFKSNWKGFTVGAVLGACIGAAALTCLAFCGGVGVALTITAGVFGAGLFGFSGGMIGGMVQQTIQDQRDYYNKLNNNNL